VGGGGGGGRGGGGGGGVARFSKPVQTGPGTHPDFYTMGTRSFPGVKWVECGIDLLPFSSEFEQKSRAIPLLHFWAFVTCYRVNFTVV